MGRLVAPVQRPPFRGGAPRGPAAPLAVGAARCGGGRGCQHTYNGAAVHLPLAANYRHACCSAVTALRCFSAPNESNCRAAAGCRCSSELSGAPDDVKCWHLTALHCRYGVKG